MKPPTRVFGNDSAAQGSDEAHVQAGAEGCAPGGVVTLSSPTPAF